MIYSWCAAHVHELNSCDVSKLHEETKGVPWQSGCADGWGKVSMGLQLRACCKALIAAVHPSFVKSHTQSWLPSPMRFKYA